METIKTMAAAAYDRSVSRMPYPTMTQVEHSSAIRRLFWARQLPPPRTMHERRILEAIWARGWNA